MNFLKSPRNKKNALSDSDRSVSPVIVRSKTVHSDGEYNFKGSLTEPPSISPPSSDPPSPRPLEKSNSASILDRKSSLFKLASLRSLGTKKSEVLRLDNLNVEVAVKVILKSSIREDYKLQKQEFANEVRILQRVTGLPNLVQYKGSLVDKSHFCIVSEMYSGGELWTYLTSLPEQRLNEFECSKVMKQILVGISHCHLSNICHLDLKPENIVLAKSGDVNSLKIVDFGCAKFTHDKDGFPVKYEEFKGSLDFAAPEVISQYVEISGEMIKAVDMWAIGVIAYFMVVGKKPFGVSNNESALRRNIYNCDYQFPAGLNLSTSVKDFISRLLALKPQDRMTVVEALDHPWIADPDSHASKDAFDPMVYRGLKNHKLNTTLHKVITRILLNSLTDKEKELITSIFNKYDEDGSGYLEANEVVKILKEAFNLPDEEAQEETFKIVSSFDANSDGVISLEEFSEISIYGSLQSNDQSRLRKAFRVLDANSDGFISLDEFKKAVGISSNGADDAFLSEADLLDLIQGIDENKDGLISFEEFSKGMLARVDSNST
jgi:serine/threonine protein kinase